MSKKWLALLVGVLCLLMCSSALAVPECGSEGSEYLYCDNYDGYRGDANMHWYECKQCGKRTGVQMHWSACTDEGKCTHCGMPYTGNNKVVHAAKCEDPTECATCGEKMPNLPIKYHNQPENHSSDDTYHWYECRTCGKTDSKGEHWSECWEIGMCSECYAPYDGSNVRPHVASCTNPGMCDNCREVFPDLPIAVHPRQYMMLTDTHHMTYCSKCDLLLKTEEHYVRCGNDPSECQECSFSGTITKVDHHWDFLSECEYKDKNTHVYYCLRCGNTRSEKHWKKCTENLIDQCNGCYCFKEVVYDLVHSDERSRAHDATSHWQICADCYEKLNEEAHYTADGDPMGFCSGCGYEYAATGKLLLSSDQAGYYDEPGGTVQFTHADATGDEWTNLVEYYGPPMEKDGYTWYVVEVGGEKYCLRSDTVTVLPERTGYVFAMDYDSVVRNQPAGNRVLEYVYWQILPCYGQPVKSESGDSWYLVETNGFAGYINAIDVAPCDAEGKIQQVDPEDCLKHYYTDDYVKVDETYHGSPCMRCGTVDMEYLGEHYGMCNETKCSACGEENVKFGYVNHGPSDWKKVDKYYHGLFCSLCKEMTENEPHTISCNDETASCTYCDAVGVETDQLSHGSTSFVPLDDEYHAFACSRCGQQFSKSEHISTCATPTVCDWCGGTCKADAKLYHGSFQTKYDGQYHWRQCETCGAIPWEKEEHYSVCDAPDTCANCGAAYEGANVLFHADYGDYTYHYDDTYHWFECSACGGQAEKAEHHASCARPQECDVCLMYGYTGDNLYHDIDYHGATGKYAWQDLYYHKYTCGWCGEYTVQERHYNWENPEGKCDMCNGSMLGEYFEPGRALFFLPDDVKVIGEEAFCGDTSLEQVVLPVGVTTIESRAFAGSSLRVINLPSTVTSIADDAFAGCSNLEYVNVVYGSYAYKWVVEMGYQW